MPWSFDGKAQILASFLHSSIETNEELYVLS